jgi:hypothetical protein
MVLEVQGTTSRSDPRGEMEARLRRLVDHFDRPAQLDWPLLWITIEDGTPALWVEVAWWDHTHGVRRAVRASVSIEAVLEAPHNGHRPTAGPAGPPAPDQLDQAVAAALARLRAGLDHP